MLYETLAKIISDMCFRIGHPLTANRISELLGHVFDEYLMGSVCRRMLEEGKLVRVGENAYTTRSMHCAAIVNALISEEYQNLGVAMLPTDNGDLVRYIPAHAEHRFLEVRPSSIGSHAGMGLFVRSTRSIPQGCIVCEYRGRLLKTLPKTLEQGVYVVRVKNTANFIDGVTERGDHLSLATFINDDGPLKANTGMMEFNRYPGRVFVVASRDLAPGDELFVMYGATYWGFSSYTEIRKCIGTLPSRAKARKRPAAELEETISYAEMEITCRGCGQTILRRMATLHAEHCADSLICKKLRSIEWMPRSELTALDVPSMLLSSRRTKALRMAKSLVKMSNPQTLSHTHEDIVGDLEFSFEDPDDLGLKEAAP